MAPVSLPSPVVRALSAHRAHVAGIKLKKGESYIDHDLVFATDKGTPYTYKQLVHLGWSIPVAGDGRLAANPLP